MFFLKETIALIFIRLFYKQNLIYIITFFIDKIFKFRYNKMDFLLTTYFIFYSSNDYFREFFCFRIERREKMDEKEKKLEQENLKKTVRYLNTKISEMEISIFEDTEKIKEFRKYAWENKGGMDKQELNAVRTTNEQEAFLLLQERDYFKKLLRIQNTPYFASIVILDEQEKKQKIYIGMTYLKDENLDNLIYDWRAPICSIFYDYEIGKCRYEAPMGIIDSYLFQKRQYKIENQKLLRIIDSAITIDDEILQEALASESSDKMKNIVTTIQQEQNSVIRNIKDKHLIVQGIAGSGKTSVALHRIAFLLYKIKNLSSDKVLIFSPNQIFTEYISNVLPELGEENTLQTTFHDYLNKMISEYKKVESYIDFLNNYYLGNKNFFALLKYKQSNQIIKDLKLFVADLEKNTFFKNGFTENKIYSYSKEELNFLFHDRYSSLPFFERITQMAIKMSENNYNGSKKKKGTYHKLLLETLGLKKDYKSILQMFYRSSFFREKMSENEIKKLNNIQEIHYDDALLLVYLKGLMEGFYYEKYIEQVIIDEAQDYSYLQYFLLSKIFKKASFTILGDVHQNINPFYNYHSLEELIPLFSGKYIELTKTYRSSEEIITYANQILQLNHICAIRKNEKKPVIIRKDTTLLKDDIRYLKSKYKSLAIITKNTEMAKELYESLNKDFSLSYVDTKTEEFIKDFIIIPAYLAKGLEFDSVIVYQNPFHCFKENEKKLYYVAVTRAQHELYIYNLEK